MNASPHPLDQAALLLGGRSVLAERLKVSVAAVGNWKVRGVPIEHCPAIERITGAQVRRQQLRPDDWREIWPELAEDAPADHPTATEAAGQGVA